MLRSTRAVVLNRRRDTRSWPDEPNANPVGRTFQKGLFEQGIPATAFEVDDLEREHQRLKAFGVVFTQEPNRQGSQGSMTLAVCADTCGNLIQLYQPLE